VSIRLILWALPSGHVHSIGAMASDREILRFCSSGSVSSRLVPSSTLPARVTAPDRASRASASVVFPAPP
jgi:hypothetical protein